MRWYGLILGSLMSFGCSAASPPTIQASDYNQTCKGDADCTLIDEGAQCCAGCGNAAINVADSAKYAADLQRRSDACKNPACIALPCVYSMAYCNAGKCDVCHGGDCPSTTDGGVKD